MATSDNILQTVATYQKSFLARLLNMNCFVSTTNKKFKDFQNMTANLGSSVTFDTPPRMISNNGLVVSSFDSIQQNTQTLTVDKARNVNFAFDASQLVFYIDNNDYRAPFEKSAIKELGSYIEQDIASVIPSNTYRFYSSGVTGSGPYAPAAIDSFTQLATILARQDEYGSADDFKLYLPNLSIPSIIGTGLSQFALDRNNRIANSWEVGEFQNASTYRSNLLPLHTSGTTGNSQQLLTVVSVTRQSDGGITSILLSGATISDTNAVKADDVFEFKATSSADAPKFLSYTGHATTALPFQFRATADAGGVAVTGNVTISVSPVIYDATSVSGNPLVARNQNVNVTIAAGQTVLGVPTHRCGLLTTGNPFYLAMPRLPDQPPFPTFNEADEDTGASLRFTTGSQFGGNSYGSILDCIWGKKLVDIYSTRLIFPTNV